MSWNFSATITPEDNARSVLDEAGKNCLQNMNSDAEDEMREQIDAAITGAVHCLKAAGHKPSASHSYYVSLSGHANPGHTPREGWANDEVRVLVTQSS